MFIVMYIMYRLSEDDILSPGFLFAFSFFFSSLWACLYASQWDLGLHENTFLVILGGVLVYSFVVIFTHRCCVNSRRTMGVDQSAYLADRRLPAWFNILFLIFTIGVALWTIIYLTHWAGLPISQFIAAGRKYDEMKFAEQHARIPSSLSTARVVVNAGGYVYAYLFFTDLVYRKKFSLTSFLIVLMGMLNDTLLGARSGAIAMFLGCVYLWLFIYQRKKKQNRFLSPRMIVSLVLIVMLLLITFRYVGILMQRSISKDPMDYLAMYIGAEIKNLDIFLQGEHTHSAGWGSQTFSYLIQSFRNKFGMANANYNLDLPYHTINGFNLGNVYTTFYPFIYDFGYVGLIVLTAIMAFLTQLSYEMARNSISPYRSFMGAMIYSNVIYTVIFAFFSNKFYENIITIGFLKKLIVWLFFVLIMKLCSPASEKLKIPVVGKAY